MFSNWTIPTCLTAPKKWRYYENMYWYIKHLFTKSSRAKQQWTEFTEIEFPFFTACQLERKTNLVYMINNNPSTFMVLKFWIHWCYSFFFFLNQTGSYTITYILFHFITTGYSMIKNISTVFSYKNLMFQNKKILPSQNQIGE